MNNYDVQIKINDAMIAGISDQPMGSWGTSEPKLTKYSKELWFD